MDKISIHILKTYKDDPETHFIDTKGFLTNEAKTKIKMTEHLYNVRINVVKRGEFGNWK